MPITIRNKRTEALIRWHALKTGETVEAVIEKMIYAEADRLGLLTPTDLPPETRSSSNEAQEGTN